MTWKGKSEKTIYKIKSRQGHFQMNFSSISYCGCIYRALSFRNRECNINFYEIGTWLVPKQSIMRKPELFAKALSDTRCNCLMKANFKCFNFENVILSGNSKYFLFKRKQNDKNI